MNHAQLMRYTVIERPDRAGALVTTDGCGEESLAANIPNLQQIDGGADGSHRFGREIARRWNLYPDLLAACEAIIKDALGVASDKRQSLVSDDAIQLARAALSRARSGA